MTQLDQADCHPLDTVWKAGQTYPGYAWTDNWKDPAITISCNDPIRKCKDSDIGAYYVPDARKHYPQVAVCPNFFDDAKFPSLDDVMDKVDDHKELSQNAGSMLGRATVLLREWLHINWGTTQICAGKDACQDHKQLISGEETNTYLAGPAKLLASFNIEAASRNNDNYVWYCAAKFMEKQWKAYPTYPRRWDATKSVEENQKRQDVEPGARVAPHVFIKVKSQNPEISAAVSVGASPLYPASDYPEWYQPMIKASFDDKTPQIQQPTANVPNYHGPSLKDVVCQTTDNSPLVEDCALAFGMLKPSPNVAPPRGGKGGSWFAGVS